MCNILQMKAISILFINFILRFDLNYKNSQIKLGYFISSFFRTDVCISRWGWNRRHGIWVANRNLFLSMSLWRSFSNHQGNFYLWNYIYHFIICSFTESYCHYVFEWWFWLRFWYLGAGLQFAFPNKIKEILRNWGRWFWKNFLRLRYIYRGFRISSNNRCI